MKASRTATVALLAGTMLVAGACGSSGGDQAATTTTVQKFDTVRPAITEAPTTSAPASTEANPPTMSRAEFEQITEGMTLAEVVQIVGGPGENTSSPQMSQLNMERYRWESDCGPGLGFWGQVILQGGKVFSATETLGLDDQEQCRAGAVRVALSDAGYGPLADGTDDAALAALGVSTCEVADASPSIEAFIPEVRTIEGLGVSAEEQGAMARALMVVYCPADFERLMGGISRP